MTRTAIVFAILVTGYASESDEWEEVVRPQPASVIASPLFIESSSKGAGIKKLGFNMGHFSQLIEACQKNEQITMDNFLPQSQPSTLTLKQVDVFTQDATLHQANSDGSVTKLERPDQLHLHGSISGDPSSFVLLHLSESGSLGLVQTAEARYSVEEDPSGHSMLVREGDETWDELREMDKYAAREEDAVGDVLQIPQTPQLTQVLQIPGYQELANTANILSPPNQTNQYYINVAIDCDRSCVAKLRSRGGAAKYIPALIAGVNVIYERDLNRGLKISYLKLWNNAKTPGFEAGARSLDAYRKYWQTDFTNKPAEYDIAHLMTGVQNGGVAYKGVACATNSYNIGVSALRGEWKGATASSAYNWDLQIVAHEIGHNFGSSHSHDYDPPLDQCVACKRGYSAQRCKAGGSALGPVTSRDRRCKKGSIMSYCHLCGGVKNLSMKFHEEEIKVITEHLNRNCGAVPTGAPTTGSPTPPTPPPTPPPTESPTPPTPPPTRRKRQRKRRGKG